MTAQKLIGMIGGTSWTSTILYYDIINKMVRERLGGVHSARIALYSIDYHPLRSLFYEQNGWNAIPALLQKEFEIALKSQPDCLLLCSNVLHKAYDEISKDLNLKIPFFHASELAAQELNKIGAKKALLLANLYTMENDFFAKPIRAHGIDISVPNVDDRKIIHELQIKLAAGETSPEIRSTFSEMLKKYEGDFEAIILACTELPLAIDQNSTHMKIVDTMQLQCQAAVDLALGSKTNA